MTLVVFSVPVLLLVGRKKHLRSFTLYQMPRHCNSLVNLELFHVKFGRTEGGITKLLNAHQSSSVRPSHQLHMLDAVHEVAVYIHRFHNLDLFEQGWYRIKVTMRWEDDDDSYPGIPARGKSSAVILKFELFHTPTPEMGPELQSSLDACAASVHEYRIPPKALSGLHSYCPVYFDVFHTVLVDTSVHISLLKSGYLTPQLKAALIKALMAAHDILLDDLLRISRGINQAIDLGGLTFESDVTKSLNSPSPAHEKSTADETSLQVPDGTQAEVLNSGKFWDDMLYSFESIGNQLLCLWNTFLKFHRENKTKILEFLRNSWANDRRNEWSIWMMYSKVDMPHQYMSNGVEGTSLYRSLRGRSSNTRRFNDDINNRSLQDMYIYDDPMRVPIIIVERLENMYRSASVKSYFLPFEDKDSHILENGSRDIIKLPGNNLQQNEHYTLCHSNKQGHHLDLRLIRNQWLLLDPKIQVLMSESNEDKTSGDFREMGLRLAQEVTSFLKKKMDRGSRVGNFKDIKLSFVGHSIGNLIVRAALAESIMEPYLRYLYTYVSISGPHLGYMYSSNSLFNSGLWLLKKIKGTQCIHQLTFTDAHDLENTFIYNLSKKGRLQKGGHLKLSVQFRIRARDMFSIFMSFWLSKYNTVHYLVLQKKTLTNFKNVVLLSSPQDGYVPYHSARIELCPAATLDFSKQGKVFLEMLNNCLDQMRTNSDHRVVMRCDINFGTSYYGKRSFNTLIGRAAHIEFLEYGNAIIFCIGIGMHNQQHV
ncbi:unnamed protein product [Sphenostylis stenocarpa]|uniref:DUF676 domain-containing protein n=1 Tax=Sphenostylis stenocarpa TaxID=92480 RepID=A0AA86T5J1_9FABA|nr:unnamed protein product [Sphenostylis stenocarpa]